MKKQTFYLLFSTLLLLIAFDAAQQYYYLTSFNLVPENSTVSFSELLLNHLYRWGVWLAVNVPFFFLVRRRFSSSPERSLLSGSLVTSLLACLALSLVLVSILSLADQKMDFTSANFLEFFQFFFYQKGLTFLLASIACYLLISSYAKGQSLKVQLIEIKELRKTNSALRKSTESKEVPHLNIKTGYKLKPIAIEEIIWIQSDDYCVKVHTKEKSYTLRKSLKDLEKKLADFRFIRIHRSVLLNLDYIEQINYRSSTVKLKDRSVVPVSKAGIKRLKQELTPH